MTGADQHRSPHRHTERRRSTRTGAARRLGRMARPATRAVLYGLPVTAVEVLGLDGSVQSATPLETMGSAVVDDRVYAATPDGWRRPEPTASGGSRPRASRGSTRWSPCPPDRSPRRPSRSQPPTFDGRYSPTTPAPSSRRSPSPTTREDCRVSNVAERLPASIVRSMVAQSTTIEELETRSTVADHRSPNAGPVGVWHHGPGPSVWQRCRAPGRVRRDRWPRAERRQRQRRQGLPCSRRDQIRFRPDPGPPLRSWRRGHPKPAHSIDRCMAHLSVGHVDVLRAPAVRACGTAPTARPRPRPMARSTQTGTISFGLIARPRSSPIDYGSSGSPAALSLPRLPTPGMLTLTSAHCRGRGECSLPAPKGTWLDTPLLGSSSDLRQVLRRRVGCGRG